MLRFDVVIESLGAAVDCCFCCQHSCPFLSQAAEAGIPCSKKQLMEFLDGQGVAFSQASVGDGPRRRHR